MSDESAEREIWISTQDDYKKSLAIARVCWGPNTPEDVIVAATATILNHHRDLKRASLPHNQPTANGQPTGPKACPDCGGEMYDNRGDKKHARSPDYKCKSTECGKAIWLTPPKGRKTANA